MDERSLKKNSGFYKPDFEETDQYSAFISEAKANASLSTSAHTLFACTVKQPNMLCNRLQTLKEDKSSSNASCGTYC
jgi:hypothetical protein